MPDQPPPRRRFQFRLRTLMIVVTMLAAASWVIADRQRLIRERDEAMKGQQAAELVASAANVELAAKKNELLQSVERFKELEKRAAEEKLNFDTSLARAHDSVARAHSALMSTAKHAQEQKERDEKLIQFFEDMLLP